LWYSGRMAASRRSGPPRLRAARQTPLRATAAELKAMAEALREQGGKRYHRRMAEYHAAMAEELGEPLPAASPSYHARRLDRLEPK